MNKEDLQALRNAYAIAVEDNIILKDRLKKIEEVITTCLTFHTCQKCKFYNECKMGLEEFILEIVRGAEE